MLCATAQQIHVAMIHPHHHARGGEIVRRLAARDSIERQPPRRGRLCIAQPFTVPVRLYKACGSAKAHQFSTIRGSGRLQAQKDTRRFNEGSFALGIPPHQQRHIGMQLELRLGEAAEIAQKQVGKHAIKLLRHPPHFRLRT